MNAHIPQVLVYHMVDPVFYWGITRITPRQFDHQIRYLSENNYESISLKQLTDPDRIKSENEICITFDDSYETVYEYAFPILQRFGMTATVFAISDYIGKWNAWDVITGGRRLGHMNLHTLAELREHSWEIGSHTSSHKNLTSLTEAQLKREIIDSKAELEEKTGHAIDFLSYPFGQFNQRIIKYVQEAGFKAACGMLFPKNLNDSKFWPYNIKRRSIYLIDTIHDYKSKLKRQNRRTFQELKERTLSFGCRGTILVSN